ncbi:MAG: hypothetical protein LCH43_11420 [Actinobacteria bacterium]|nr:hypothetical protein [Actinomycetota bacterium]
MDDLGTRVQRDIVLDRTLPTPTAKDADQSGGAAGSSNLTLTDVAQRGRELPTPSTSNRSGNQRNSRGDLLLPGVAETLMPTPKAGDADFGLPRTSGRPPEKSTHLATRLHFTLPEALLKTPTSQLAANGGSQHPSKRKEGGHGPTLADEVEHLLPTPMASDGEKGGPNQRGGSGDLRLSSAVPLLGTPTTRDWKDRGRQENVPQNGLLGRMIWDLLPEEEELLPTPAASVANDGEGTETWLARRERVKLTAKNGNGMGMPLTIAALLLEESTGESTPAQSPDGSSLLDV